MSTYASNTWIFSDDPDWGKEEVLEYDPSPVNMTGLSVFLLIAISMFSINVIATRRQYKKLVMLKAGSAHRGLWWTNIRTRLNCIQTLGSFLHVVNTAYFMIMEVGRWLPCSVLVTLGGLNYACMVMCIGAVMIQRSTTLLQGRHRRIVRILMYSLLLTGVGFVAASNAYRMWHEGLAKLGVCSARWNRKLNTIGKLIISLVYVWFLVVFVQPLWRHSHAMRQLASHHANQTSLKLDQIVRSLFIKISFCIFALVFGTVVGTFQLFGRYVTLEFSIQNTAMVYASTLALERFGRVRATQTGSDHGSTLVTQSVVPAAPELEKSRSFSSGHMEFPAKLMVDVAAKSINGTPSPKLPPPTPKLDHAIPSDQGLKRVCSGVWVDEDNEPTCIEMGSSMSLDSAPSDNDAHDGCWVGDEIDANDISVPHRRQ